jgi:hypothetical protein
MGGAWRTGLEDEYARSGSLPKLVYIKTPAPKREPKLQALISRIQSDDEVSYRLFAGADELRSFVADDLAVLLTERFERSVASPTSRFAKGRGYRARSPA